MNAAATRVRTELTSAGMSKYGRLKLASRYLYHLIHDDEHILSVVYGRYDGGGAELVATNQRVLFLDKKPLFANCEEIPYNIISGIKHSAGGLFASVTLQTRVGNFKLVYANRAAARKFVDLIDEHIEQRTTWQSSGEY